MAGHNGYCLMRDKGGAYLDDKGILVFGSNYEELRGRAAGKKTTILIEQSNDYEVALNDIRNNKYGSRSIAIFDRSKNPDELLPRLDDKITKVHLLYNVPESFEEAQAVHSLLKEVWDGNEKLFRSVVRDFKRLGGTKIGPNGGSTAEEWLQSYITNLSNKDLVIVASHVEEDVELVRNAAGLMVPTPRLVLPLIDKSKFTLSSVKGADRPLVWTVGCNTWDVMSSGKSIFAPEVSISRPILYPQSVSIVRELKIAPETPRTMVEAVQRIEVPRALRKSKSASGPKRSGRHHSDPTPPATKMQVIVENIDGNNILTNRTGVA